MKNTIPLTELALNLSGKIISIDVSPNIKRRLLDLGIIPNTSITPVFKSTGGDPIAYEIRGTVLAIRNQDAENILVSLWETTWNIM